MWPFTRDRPCPPKTPGTDAEERAYTLARLDCQIAWYETHAARNGLGHKVCKLVTIVSGALIAVSAAANVDPLGIAVAGAVVVVAQSIEELGQFQANWINFATTKELLRREKSLYVAKAGPYNDSEIFDRHRLLAERTEAVTASELDAWAETQRGKARAEVPARPADGSADEHTDETTQPDADKPSSRRSRTTTSDPTSSREPK
jgi:hypothetical protein